MVGLRTDRLVLLATLVLAAVYFYATEQLPAMQVGDPLGPKAFPRLLGIGLLIAAALLYVEIRRKAREATKTLDEPEAADDRPAWGLLAALVISTGVYFSLFEPVGYVLATAAYLVALMAYFNPGKWAVNTVSSVIFSVLSYLAFDFLGVSLPQGLLPF
jgi:putative tricarboxylic transport membrane protein